MKIIFLDTVHPILEEKLKLDGHEAIHYLGQSKDEIAHLIADVDGIVIRSKVKLDKTLLDKALQLKFIARAGAGMENIDVTYAESKGIHCLHSPEGNKDAVGEHIIGMLLMLMNRLKIADSEVRNGIWLRAENRGYEIMGKTIGIIGFGNNGSALAKKLSGFGCTILAYDKYKTGFGNDFVKESNMDEIFAQADIVSLHIPLTEKTYKMVNSDFFANFIKPIYFVNAARGKIVETAALISSLKNGKIKGACLDVLEYEAVSFEQIDAEHLPADFQYLIQADNVILTPHIAGWTHESNYKLSNVLYNKIKNIFG